MRDAILKSTLRALKVTGNAAIQQVVYDFLFMFNSNVPTKPRFGDISG